MKMISYQRAVQTMFEILLLTVKTMMNGVILNSQNSDAACFVCYDNYDFGYSVVLRILSIFFHFRHLQV